jgi:tartrate dehydrogenase/decarboxylase / D-malate dehydrogenase
MTRKEYKIAAIGGDGIGVEVVDACLEVLTTLAERDGSFAFDLTKFDWATDRYKRIGEFMPTNGAGQLRAFDAILFGAVGAPDVPDHLTLWVLPTRSRPSGPPL